MHLFIGDFCLCFLTREQVDVIVRGVPHPPCIQVTSLHALCHTVCPPCTTMDESFSSVVSDSLRPRELQHGRPPCRAFTCSLFSCHVVSNSLWPHGLQHTRHPCPSLSPRVCPNSWPLSWWCHPTISSSVVPFSSCLQSLPGSGSFPMSRLFASGGQRIRASASASVLSKTV